MKTTIYSFIAGVAGMLMVSCADFTDIQPKGENLLESTNDLELLLNTSGYSNMTHMMDYLNIGSNTVYGYREIAPYMREENKMKIALLYGYYDDEASLNRLATLTTSDSFYTGCYNIVGRVCNPILTKLETISGSEEVKRRLRAEALVVRAFCHYQVLQKFAPAYNGSNGDAPAIIYMTEDKDILQIHAKNTIQECYDQMLKDVNDALELNALPVTPINLMRWGKPAALALKAHILMGMRKYSEAESAAKEVLAINNSLYDYWANTSEATTRSGKETYLFEQHSDWNNPETLFLTPDNLTYYIWTSPNEWNALEENYGRRGLTKTYAKNNKGYITSTGEDYTDTGFVYIGLSGWDSPDFREYLNFLGLSVPQMYLLIAECEYRGGNVNSAMNWLDQLRAKRLPVGFEKLEGSVTANSEAIKWIEKTAVAEYIWTGWTFISRKRWNVDSDWATTQSHEIDGVTYTLRPDSKLWIFPFPMNAKEKNVNLTDNW